ncbi:hypothetical protein [Alicyclobacillus tolerans]|uniref:Uncharacterized protein n=1 Tax=Alicyclobacillus tolerans TaxID=90970 RepID=A0A1M6MLG8_9BACL|nr:hypothetical protein [Alicyclobacillus montanus]SHJ84321.1 hypothetical protein SAMN05443507_104105 [Alicyclobacillus montanus]
MKYPFELHGEAYINWLVNRINAHWSPIIASELLENLLFQLFVEFDLQVSIPDEVLKQHSSLSDVPDFLSAVRSALVNGSWNKSEAIMPRKPIDKEK